MRVHHGLHFSQCRAGRPGARISLDRALRKLFPSTSKLTFNPLFRAAVNSFDVVPRLIFPEFRTLPPNHLRIRIGVGNRILNNQTHFLVHARDFWMFVFSEGIATMHSDILDIGVGCGRWAHWLRDYIPDAWFLGFSPSITCGVWIGYDSRQSLGDKETGAHAALPIWMQFMKVAIVGKDGEVFAGDSPLKPLNTAGGATVPSKPAGAAQKVVAQKVPAPGAADVKGAVPAR